MASFADYPVQTAVDAEATTPVFRPTTLISGGQTGADSIALAVWRQLRQTHPDWGIGLRGYMPKGCQRADGDGEAVAKAFGLWEGEGGNKWRDSANAGLSDALVAFLSSAPMTGRGTMSTVNIFVNGQHKFVPLERPEDGHVAFLGSSALGVADSDVGERIGQRELSSLPREGGSRWRRAADSSGSSSQGLPSRGGDQEQCAFLHSASHPKYPVSWDKKAKAIDFTQRPVLVFWDVTGERVGQFAVALADFLREYKPQNLMVSGPLETTLPGVESLGAEVMLKAFGFSADCAAQGQSGSG